MWFKGCLQGLRGLGGCVVPCVEIFEEKLLRVGLRRVYYGFMLVQFVRQALKSDPRSLPRIAAAAGIHRIALWRFSVGKGGLSVQALDRLMVVLGLEVTRRDGR